MGPGPGYLSSAEPLKRDQAKKLLEHCIVASGNPDIRLGKISDMGEHFEAAIIAKDGSLVGRLSVDKRTGWIRSVS
jgi:hypothetical protein